ncbi:MAG TPA: DinB family protein [Acidobacteriaceae bacterium]|nr:DinB family protein [Acidobacteriaceae bacterium]
MSELVRALIGDSAATPPSHILEGVSEDLARRPVPSAPHTIYDELWHITFWQQVTLDWVNSIETPFPMHASAGFPDKNDHEPWEQLCRRFYHGLEQSAEFANDEGRLSQKIRCPSRPGHPVRMMTVREQLESLVAHNAYHFGRIVLLRQLLRSWPPVSGGFSW